jgi:hypothetical protein
LQAKLEPTKVETLMRHPSNVRLLSLTQNIVLGRK